MQSKIKLTKRQQDFANNFFKQNEAKQRQLLEELFSIINLIDIRTGQHVPVTTVIEAPPGIRPIIPGFKPASDANATIYIRKDASYKLAFYKNGQPITPGTDPVFVEKPILTSTFDSSTGATHKATVAPAMAFDITYTSGSYDLNVSKNCPTGTFVLPIQFEHDGDVCYTYVSIRVA